MLVLSILAALVTVGLASAVTDARVSRTRTVINKIDALIQERWEGYRTRSVPIRIPPTTHPQHAQWAARARLYALRELMRMEMPDRITDVLNLSTAPPTLQTTVIPGIPRSSVQQSYYRLALRNAAGGVPANLTNWTTTHQGSECLYLILSTMKDGHKGAINYFSTDEIGDTDGDGMKEILDGWGRPIEFLRWAPGYSQHPGPDGGWGISGTDDDGNTVNDDIFEAGWPGSDDVAASPTTLQTRIAVQHPTRTDVSFAPDPYDPVRVDPRVCKVALSGPFFSLPGTPINIATDDDTFALKPLIFSAGIDGTYDVNTQGGLVANTMDPPNDPYYRDPSTGIQAGMVGDADGDGNPRGWADNITNHDNTAQ
jgi:hypothetical protein